MWVPLLALTRHCRYPEVERRGEGGGAALSSVAPPKSKEEQRRVAAGEFYLEQLRLFAELCTGRNYDCIHQLRHQFSFALL
eukprot:2920870-Rhodomonas_salina.3